MTRRLAIFDCDGTLVDSQASIYAALRACFARAALPTPSRERARRVVGLSLPRAMEVLLPQADPDLHVQLCEDYKQAFQALRADGLLEEPLFEGVAELLDMLEAEGWLLGIATGKSDRGVALCLGCHGLARRFCTIQTGDRHPSKPHPSMIEAAIAETGAGPEATLMIGDTSYDIEMAKAAGVAAIGVGWGYHDRAELVAAGADYIADHPQDIAPLTKAFA